MLLIALMLAACGQTDRVVDKDGKALSEKTLKSAEASMKASKTKKSAIVEQADQIVRQAAFQRSLGKEVKMTSAQLSILEKAENERNGITQKDRASQLASQLQHHRMRMAKPGEAKVVEQQPSQKAQDKR